MEPGLQRLPARLTRFFGREAEIAELRGLVEQVPLLTLVGAPGGGKTRLGVEVAASLDTHFADGVHLVELAPFADPQLIANAVGLTLGVPEQPGRPMAETLTERLAAAEVLLILDNCEHVAGAVAGLVDRLLASCPTVHVLATSRAALGLRGEQVWRVPPLDAAPAVELFADRAGLASGGFRIDDANRSLTEEICQRLAGLPLAIELIAAWARVLSLGQIASRLGDALPLLRSEARDVSARQRTMEASVDWSLQPLDPRERRLFDWLSVFAGGFDLEAAAAISESTTSSDVLDALTCLVDHSLVLATAHGGSEEPMRYRLLEPVRQCGAARLAVRDETDTIRQRHADYYQEVARQCDAELRSGQRARALRRLEQEDGNLLAALEWARGHRPDLGLRLGAALAHFWELRGRVNDGRAWLDDMLAGDVTDRQLRATALSRTARLAWRQRDHPSARALLEESLTIKRALGDDLGVARRQRDLALVAMSERDVARAVQLCQQSVGAFRSESDDQGLVWALEFLGLARYIAGDLPRGDAHIEEALAVNRRVGNDAATTAGLLYRSYAAAVAGDVAAERTHVLGALAAMRRSGGAVEEPDWLLASASLAVAEGRVRSGLRLAAGAEALSRRGGTYLNEPFMAPLDDRVAQARRKVGPAVADRLQAEGARMTLDELLAEATAEPGDDAHHPLTSREQEVADLVAQGLTNVEIARELFISRRTVESHVDHVKQKLGLPTRQQVMAWGLGQVLRT